MEAILSCLGEMGQRCHVTHTENHHRESQASGISLAKASLV